MATDNPRWLDWAQRLQAIAQTGLSYAQSPFDVERYEQIRAIAAEITAESSGCDQGIIDGLFALDVGHATPKVDTRGVVFQGDTILLVKERADGKWTLPGGWVDIGESPSESVVRELREESGYETRAVKLLALYDRNKHDHPPLIWHAYKLFFLCELIGGAPVSANNETTEVGFFHKDALPELSLGRITPRQLTRLFEHARHPEWPTDFD